MIALGDPEADMTYEWAQSVDQILNYSSSDNVWVLTKEAKHKLLQVINDNPEKKGWILTNIQSAREWSYEAYRALHSLLNPEAVDSMVWCVVGICDWIFKAHWWWTGDELSFPKQKEVEIRIFIKNPYLWD
jgi:hypothetical protein